MTDFLQIYENGTHGQADWKYFGNGIIGTYFYDDPNWPNLSYASFAFIDLDGNLYTHYHDIIQEAINYAIPKYPEWSHTDQINYVTSVMRNIVDTGIEEDITWYKFAFMDNTTPSQIQNVTGPWIEDANGVRYWGYFDTDYPIISELRWRFDTSRDIWETDQSARYSDLASGANFEEISDALPLYTVYQDLEDYIEGDQEPPIDPPDEPADWEDDPINPSSNYDNIISGFLSNFSVLAEIDNTNLNKIAQALNNDVTIYNTTQEALAKVVRALVQKNVSEGILSLKIVPIPEGGSLPYKTGTAEKLFAPIGVGDVYGKVLNNTIKKYTIGSQQIKPIYNDYRDYMVEYSIYLPFSGIHKLDADIIVGTTLIVKCDIDFLTGGIMYHIIIDDNTTSRDIYTFTGDCAIELPITGVDYSEKYQSIMNGVFSGVGMLAGGAMMGPGGAAGAGMLMALGTMSGLQTAGNAALVKGDYMQSGKLVPNSSVLSPLYPYLIISMPQDATPDIKAVKGLPCHKTGLLSQFTGFTIASNVKLDGIPYATDDDKEIIRAMLKSGVYL